jgi:antitoxin component of RelBE/YafQ-DinJ toxin-antitoxin module
MRMSLKRVARDKKLPFDPTPNAGTADVLRKSRRGEDVQAHENMDALFKRLGI